MKSKDRQLLRDFYQSLPTGPLEPGDPRYWPIYSDRRFTSADPVEMLARGIEWEEQANIQVLSGSRGSGKTTELKRLAKRLQGQEIEVSNISANSGISWRSSSRKRVLIHDGPLDDASETAKIWRERHGCFVVLGLDPWSAESVSSELSLRDGPQWVSLMKPQMVYPFGGDRLSLQPGQKFGGVLRLATLEKLIERSGGAFSDLWGILRRLARLSLELPIGKAGDLDRVMSEWAAELTPNNVLERWVVDRVAKGWTPSQVLSTGVGPFMGSKKQVEHAEADKGIQRLAERGALLHTPESGFFVHPLLESSRSQADTIAQPMGHYDAQSTEPEPPIWLRRIDIQAIRGLETLELDLSPDDQRSERGQWTLLLGDNGTGKTTILRSLALALSSRRVADGLLQSLGSAAPYLRHGASAGEISVELGSLKLSVSLTSDSEGFETLSGLEWVTRPSLFAYGCQRGTALGGPKREVDLNRPLDSVLSLFDPSAHLIHAETWLRDLDAAALKDSGGADEAFYESVRETLVGALNGVESLTVDKNGVWLEGEKIGRSTLAGLSDGYVTTAGWLMDLIARWSHRRRAKGALLDGDFRQQMTGLVLIDEIDLHLHPLWQMDVVKDLRALFPKMSFVATTHNPLSLLGGRPGEIFVLRRDDQGLITCHQRDIPPGTRADQVLTGEWFGLPSTVDFGTRRLLAEHRQLLRQGVKRGDERRQTLERELQDRLGVFEDTAIDRLVQSIAAELIPDDYEEISPEERLRLRSKILALAKARKTGSEGLDAPA